MTTSRFAKAAWIKHVLVFYDGPQLALLETDRGHSMLAIAVRKGGMTYPMFATEIIGNQLEKYLQGKADLNFVFRTTPVNRLYFFDLGEAKDDRVNLVRATKPEAQENSFYPDVGVFSRSHTHPLNEEEHKGDVEQRFLIDGTWEASDFSGFYGKIADTYALAYISTQLETESATQVDRLFLKDSITEKNWQGGGSYSSFYVGMRGRTRSRHPLQVRGIEYHSPGYIDVVGNKAVLGSVIAAINRLIENHENISKLYRALYRVLRKEGLLRADKSGALPTEASERYVFNQSVRLADMVGLPNPNQVFEGCDSNYVVFAKVVLSFSRRISNLARFYIEGRVKTG